MLRGVRAIVFVSLLELATACNERVPSAPQTTPASTGQLLACQADVRAGTLSCAAPGASSALSGASAISGDVIFGGQGMYVQLSSSNVRYDATSQIFQADVTVENLTPLTLGTPDGSTVTGVKVFFYSGPSVTSGTGMVTVANADGVGAFTGTNQPYFLYDQILQQGQVSAPKTWQWTVPSTVVRFVFQVLVDARAPVESFFKLSVSVLGAGTITSTPAAINCTTGTTGTCSAIFLPGTSVSLSEAPASGWGFSVAGWGGDCAGSAGTATLVMTQNRSCSVAFLPYLTVSTVGSGAVTSSPAGINCGGGSSGACSAPFPLGTSVTLTATPATAWVFSKWSGDCTGTGGCAVSMSNLRAVGVLFLGPPASLVIAPKPLVFEVGGRPNVDVTVTDVNGNTLPNPTITYASRNPSVASFAPGGILDGLAQGQSVVAANATGGTSPSDSLLAIVAAVGGPVVMTDIAQFSYKTNTVFTVTVIIDMRDSGEKLGSATVTVSWNPALLSYQSDALGGSGVSPSVNVSNVAGGSLVLSIADQNGFSGRVELLKVTFAASSTAGVAGVLSLIPSDVTGAGTFTDLLPKTVAVTYPLITR